ncbi:penicillin-binding protein 1F [Paenibacillus sp. J45TS6]|uniref:penicillin-binding protein 1A n=1 Tax=Paenibacillus sp. J45TS6 TaxID=2807196 RepID=UPI001B09A3C0|nr:penicillin-binding protein 1A [Paenibacillus sp. J45TS6]GIP41555.1 penicillin-binding protein 1F [Paenibacillus sp. J45TS6]
MSNDTLSRSGNRNNKNNKKKPSDKKAGSKKKKFTRKRVGWTLFFTAAFAIFIALAGYLFIMVSGERILTANLDKMTVNETSKVYDSEGNEISELSIENWEPAKEDEIPQLVKDAFVATEDRRFYEHNGVDLWSIARAAVKDVMARSLVEGGSTISQQLAKNVFLTRDKTFFRKATEVSIALAIERKYTKDEILTMYLNRVWFGYQEYGIKAASQFYFGKDDLEKLELWEIATLAAIPKGPSAYNPSGNPIDSKARRGVVLDLMYEQGYISKEEMEEAKEVEYTYERPKEERKYDSYVDYVLKEAEEVTGKTTDDLNIGGYQIYTAMSTQAQEAVEEAFKNDDLFEDSPDDEKVQGSMVIMDHETGSIVALQGGRDYQRQGFNRATSSYRQPGSAFKPIASYAPALETGKFTKNSSLSNEQQCFGNYCPKNLHGYSSTIGMADAITKSENIPAVWLLNQIGVGTGYDFAKKLGITMTEDDRNLSMALGGLNKGTNTLEMAAAYSAFANRGQYQEGYAITKIVNSDGKTIYEHKDDKEQVMSEETAYQMTEMMQEVVNSGTGTSARLSRPVAGKTGTTQSGISGNSANRDVWFVGYTPEYTAAVWMGYDEPDSEHMLKNSSKLAATFFSTVMEKALEGVERKEFFTPKNEIPDTPVAPPVEEPEVDVSVSGLSASYDVNQKAVSLSWKGSSAEGEKYRVYRKESSEGSFTRIQDGISETSATDTGALPGLTYEYYVTAINPVNGEDSAPSNTVTLFIEAEEVIPEEPEQPETIPDEEDENTGENQNGNDNGENNGNGNGNGTGNGTNEGNGNGNGSGNGSSTGNGNANGNSDGNNAGNESGGGETETPDRGDNSESGGGNETTTPEETVPPASETPPSTNGATTPQADTNKQDGTTP